MQGIAFNPGTLSQKGRERVDVWTIHVVLADGRRVVELPTPALMASSSRGGL
jgi:hypothetical protein